jgi:hypothetical protein
MSRVSQPSENVKQNLAAALDTAVAAADAYDGPTDLDWFRGHGDWDRVGDMPADGFLREYGHTDAHRDMVLWHDEHGVTPMPSGEYMPCPYCKVRSLERAYRALLRTEKEGPHEPTTKH